MASKKYLLLLAVIIFTTINSFSQVKIGTYYDSSQIPQKRMAQHTEFLNGTYNFPAKPRNQWEIGIKAGLFQISGDIPAKFISPGFGIHVRKAFGYIFSMRLEYMYGIGKGYHFRASGNYAKNPAWGTNIVTPAQRYNAPKISPAGPGGSLVYLSSVTGLPPTSGWDQVYYNYKSIVQDLSLEGIITLNNIRFHKAKTGFNVYAIAGFGGTIYDTKVNALNGASKYDFNSIAQAPYKTRQTFLKNMRNNVLDKTFETPAENQGDRRPKLFGDTFKPSGTIGMGLGFKLSNRINIALEDRWTLVKDDLLDGQRWQEQTWGDASLTRDFDSYNFLSLGLNINIGSRSVEPLWWLNPLDYAYSEIRNPRLMRLPKPVLPDSDGDGVTDQFDLEQTPAGCPVDSHGVTKDTDGDGVPDCKDKELITPTYCQPVDADGVGKCPVPCPTCENCPDLCKGGVAPSTCAQTIGSLPSVAFKTGSNKLSDDAKALLATVAAKLRNNPGCKIVVIGYCSSNKKEQQLSWDHVNTVINYMVDNEGISADRFIFNYGQEGGDCNTVDMRVAADGEDGPNRVEPPHPNLRKN
ncbi:MAG TPA: OmpA family protein [Chitinophagaceae bacterium]|nr:OmpA family protein [Chitinophagaceae bacterium]